MLEWLLVPADPERVHLITSGLSWHGRLMVFVWGVLSPLVILITRFAKILPRQDWPRDLDNQFWWKTHWGAHTLAILLTVLGIGIIFFDEGKTGQYPIHRLLGFAVLACAAFQGVSGLLRGTKGGATAPNKDGSLHGDHYNMTLRRRIFERVHKTVGYLTLLIAFMAIPHGMWIANAPRWMFLSLFSWWVLLIAALIMLQSKGCAADTSQAIWGPGKEHPGNKAMAAKWGAGLPLSQMKTKSGD